jgi:hypothetical protein
MTVSLTYLKAFSWGTTRWTSSQEMCARRILTSCTRRMARRKHSITPAVSRGVPVREEKSPTNTGEDVIIVRDGKIAALYGFLDSKSMPGGRS